MTRNQIKAEHTPGPWEWADVKSVGIIIRAPYEDGTRKMFQDIWRPFPEPIWDATMLKNAQLAAAAPELLEALRLCLFQIEMPIPSTNRVNEKREAIQAARYAITRAIGDIGS
jgi:hypothetical protein